MTVADVVMHLDGCSIGNSLKIEKGWSWLSEVSHRSSVDIGVIDRVVASEAY